MIAGRHSTMCACGLPMLLRPDVAIQACAHCDTGDCQVSAGRAHPSVVCPECETLKASVVKR